MSVSSSKTWSFIPSPSLLSNHTRWGRISLNPFCIFHWALYLSETIGIENRKSVLHELSVPQSLVQNYVHPVFSTKNRQPFLQPLRGCGGAVRRFPALRVRNPGLCCVTPSAQMR